MLETHALNTKKGQQKAKEERGLGKGKPLTKHYTDQGGDKHDLLKCFQRHGDYITLMIMSQYMELIMGTEFHDLSPQQREAEVLKLFPIIMGRYIDEFDK